MLSREPGRIAFRVTIANQTGLRVLALTVALGENGMPWFQLVRLLAYDFQSVRVIVSNDLRTA